MNSTIDTNVEPTVPSGPEFLPGKLVSYPPVTTPDDFLKIREVTAATLAKGLIQGDDLDTIEISVREDLCGSWFREGDLGFVFAERGLGKTWFGMSLSRSLAEGRSFGPWRVEKPRKVLYVDGEMPLDSLRDRDQVLRQGPGALTYLNHERLFDKAGAVLNLTDTAAQGALLKLCVDQEIKVIVFDNLSCLFSGMVENDANDWEQVLPWLLCLRRRKIAVVIIHHSGRAGQNMRGTSRREDAATWIVRLNSVADPMRESDGARFVSQFTKRRQGAHSELEKVDWHFDRQGSLTVVTFKQQPNTETFKQLIRDGLNTCSEIADEMEMSKASVCKIAKCGESEGWLRIKSRTYQLVEDALDA